jgi:hypothetical protein
MFGTVRSASWQSGGCRFAGLVAAGALSLLLGACAHNAGDAPALEWQATTVDATGAAVPGYGAAEASSNTGCAAGGDGCYVYRGGRDPATGLASTQL